MNISLSYCLSSTPAVELILFVLVWEAKKKKKMHLFSSPVLVGFQLGKYLIWTLSLFCIQISAVL